MNILAVIPVDTEKLGMPYDPAPDRKQIACELCDQMAWIGPKQLAMKAEQDCKIICAYCLMLSPDAKDLNIQSLGGT